MSNRLAGSHRQSLPQFTPAQTINVEWTWDMRQSGSLPPGANIWWRWRYTDESGASSSAKQKTLHGLMTLTLWQTITEDGTCACIGIKR
jgi:hypothetical protein